MNPKFFIAGIAVVIAVICGPVPVAMGNEHGAAMEKQHHAMQAIQRDWLKAKSAVEKGHAGSAAGPATEIERSAMYMDNFMLHKNPGGKEQFLEKTHKFRDLVAKFRRMAKKGDIIALNKLATQIDAACEDCHASFR